MSCVLPESIKALQADVKKNGGARFLRDMSSEDRIDYFAKFTDYNSGDKITNRENAEILNRQVEQKMLQPAQIAGIQEWLHNLPKDKRINTLGRDNDIIEKIREHKGILDPKASKPYLEALVKQTFGFDVSVEDARTILQLADTASAARKKLNQVVPGYDTMSSAEAAAATLEGDGRAARDALGDALLKFKEQHDIMKIKAKTGMTAEEQTSAIKGIKSYYNDLLTKGKTGKTLAQIGYNVAGTLKAAKASADVSFLLRQLSGVWFTNRKAAARASAEGLKVFWGSLKTGDGRSAAMRELMTRPNALNGNYERFGLEIGITEEAFAANIFQKVKDKSVGKVARVISASDDSFSVAMQTARAEMFDVMWDQSKGDVQLLVAQDVGDAINTITGRGKLPTDNSVAEKFVNVAMFSPRWLSSRIQMVTNLRYIGSYFKNTPNGLRAKAAVNNAIFMAGMSAIGVAVRAAFRDEDDETVEEMVVKTFDPRSADFMQVKIGDLHADTSAGVANFMRFVARAMTGEVRTGEGAIQKKTPGDIFARFLASKESPLAQNTIYLYQYLFSKDPKDFNYDPITWKTFAAAMVPISVQNVAQLSVSHPETFGAVALDVVGISSQYWGESPKNEGKTRELVREQERLAFKLDKPVRALKATKTASLNTKLTGARRDRANREFEQTLSAELNRLIATPAYKKMSDDEKSSAMSKIRTQVQNKVKKKYGIK